MRRPFLIFAVLAISLVVLLFGYGGLVVSAHYPVGPWGMMGPQMIAAPCQWDGCGPGFMLRGYGPPWSASGDLKLSVDSVKSYLDR